MDPCVMENNLIEQYFGIIKKIRRFECAEDKYSGVFLPIPHRLYWESKTRVMLVGRETAGWNTDNGKNTLKLILERNENDKTHDIINESICRYRQLYDCVENSKNNDNRSKFRQFHNLLLKELPLSPEAVVRCNLLAWDYAKKTPLNRPSAELEIITSISLELLAVQLKAFAPHFIIFATGYDRITPIIKRFFNYHVEGKYQTIKSEPKKLWEFQGGGAKCFRIAHPRAQYGHQAYRYEVVNRIRNYMSGADVM